MPYFERAARAHIKSRGSLETQKLYLGDLARWVAFCELENIDIDAPTIEGAAAFREDLKSKLGSQTIRRTLSALSSMYAATGDVNVFHARRLARPAANDVSLTKEFTEEEAKALLGAAEAEAERTPLGMRDAAVFWTLYSTGMRVGNAMQMRRERLARRDGVLSVMVKVKNKGLVEVTFPEEAAKWVDRWLSIAPESAYVFTAMYNSKACSRGTIYERLEHYGKLLGINNPHPHRFRASFATEALNAGMPLHEVQAAMHHSDPKTTLRYDRGVRGAGVTSALAEFRKRNGK